MIRKISFLVLIGLLPFLSIAQDEKEIDTLEGWKSNGKVALLLNQAAFNEEWTGGGTTNYSGNISATYDINYKRDKVNWDNRVLVDFGFSKNRDDRYSRKTIDKLEINSIIGHEIDSSHWYYSLFTNFKTQMAKGFEYNKDLDQNDPGYRKEITHIFSPGYWKFGPGILWKKNDKLFVNIAPATSRITFVDRRFTKVNIFDAEALEAYNKKKYFGIDANKSHRYELGASVAGYAKFKLMKNVSAENILNLYSNYLEEAKNIDIDYTLNLVLKVNKHIVTNIAFQAIYDDDAVRGFQIREGLGIGVTYDF